MSGKDDAGENPFRSGSDAFRGHPLRNLCPALVRPWGGKTLKRGAGASAFYKEAFLAALFLAASTVFSGAAAFEGNRAGGDLVGVGVHGGGMHGSGVHGSGVDGRGGLHGRRFHRGGGYYGGGFPNRLPGYLGPTWGFGFTPDPCMEWNPYSKQWEWIC